LALQNQNAMKVFITVFILLLTVASPLMIPDVRGEHSDGVARPKPDPTDSAFCNNIRNTAFNAGENLTYKVSYVVAGISLSGGEATFKTDLEKLMGKNVYHVVAEGKSYHDVLFKVRDKYETYIDTSTLQPYKFIRNVNEGGYKTIENVSFYKATNTAITNTGTYQVPSCIQDVLSAIFYARNIDFAQYKPGDRIPFDMFLDRQVYHLYIRYLGRETIRTKSGKFRTFKFKPLLVKGTMFQGGEKMTVWVTDDPNHIAVRVQSPITVGKVSVDMTDCQNLRYPLSSRIDS
jgi:Protein of unknown function (DUF3108)